MIRSVGGVEVLPKHRLSCHCGAVVLELDLPAGIVDPQRCNCSLCRRKGAVVATVPRNGLRVIQGERALRLYQFHTRVARHYFCSHCGIYTHHQRRSNPDEYGYNVGCLEGIDPLLVEHVPVSDGINLQPISRHQPPSSALPGRDSTGEAPASKVQRETGRKSSNLQHLETSRRHPRAPLAQGLGRPTSRRRCPWLGLRGRWWSGGALGAVGCSAAPVEPLGGGPCRGSRPTGAGLRVSRIVRRPPARARRPTAPQGLTGAYDPGAHDRPAPAPFSRPSHRPNIRACMTGGGAPPAARAGRAGPPPRHVQAGRSTPWHR